MKRGEGKYYNPDPLYHLIGRTNETPLEVDGHKITGLIDSGANISSISKSFAEKLGLPFRQLESLLEIEGSGGIDMPYLGYTEVNLKVPGVKAFNEDILVVIQNDSTYSARVPVALGTLHIDMVIDQATPEELANLGKEWQSGTVGFKVKARQAALRGEGKPMIDRIDHEIKLSKNITLQPRQATKSTGMVKLPVLSKRLNVMTEPKENVGDITGVNSVETYATVKTGTKRVAVALVNNSGDKVTIKKGTVVGRLKAANAVPICLAPKTSTDNDVLEYVQRMRGGVDVPEYKNTGTKTKIPNQKNLLSHLREVINYSASWIYREWRIGQMIYSMKLSNCSRNITTCLPCLIWNWDAHPISNTKSSSIMKSLLRIGIEGYPHSNSRRSETTCKTCSKSEPSNVLVVPGLVQWSWYAKRMGV